MPVPSAGWSANLENPETVNLTLKRSAGDISVTEVVAQRRALSRTRFAAAEIELTGNEVVWNIDAAYLEDNEIQPQDLIQVSEDEVWTVLYCDLRSFRQRWWCVCAKQL